MQVCVLLNWRRAPRHSFGPCRLTWSSGSLGAGVSPQKGLWALWMRPPCFGGEREHSCEDASCAVPVLHRIVLGIVLGLLYSPLPLFLQGQLRS